MPYITMGHDSANLSDWIGTRQFSANYAPNARCIERSVASTLSNLFVLLCGICKEDPPSQMHLLLYSSSSAGLTHLHGPSKGEKVVERGGIETGNTEFPVYSCCLIGARTPCLRAPKAGSFESCPAPLVCRELESIVCTAIVQL